MSRFFSVVCVFIVLFSSQIKHAEADMFAICNACETNATFEAVAVIKVLEAGKYQDKIYVFNEYTESFHKYDVTITASKDPLVKPVTRVVKQSLKASEIDARNQLIEAKRGFMLGDVSRTIPASVLESGYDLSGASYAQNDLFDYLNENFKVAESALTYGGAVLEFVSPSSTSFSEFTPTFEVTFADGAIGNIVVKGLLTLSPEMGVRSAIDAENNNIPLTKAEGLKGNSFRFGASAAGREAKDRFSQRMRNWGISVTGDDTSREKTICDAVDGDYLCRTVQE